MHGTFFDIGLGLGLATASGLRPYLPALLAGALASAKVLGVRFAHGHFHFLQAGWWLLLMAVLLALAYAAQLRIGAEPFGAAWEGIVAAQAIAVGALLFAGTLAAHGETWWPGLIGGIAAAAFARAVVAPVLSGARGRLQDRAAREALTVYVDGVALVLAALVAVLHPLGYVAVILLAVFAQRRRSRAGERYAGLRILGR